VTPDTPTEIDTPPETPPPAEGEKRVHPRIRGAATALRVDLGAGPVDVHDWSYGGARLHGTALALDVGDFVTGTLTMGTATGPFIAHVVRVDPPYFDPQRPPDTLSLRWLDLPPGMLEQMIAATPSKPLATP